MDDYYCQWFQNLGLLRSLDSIFILIFLLHSSNILSFILSLQFVKNKNETSNKNGKTEDETVCYSKKTFIDVFLCWNQVNVADNGEKY